MIHEFKIFCLKLFNINEYDDQFEYLLTCV